MTHTAEVLLEKYYNIQPPEINDFDAVFSSVTRSNVSHIRYTGFEYVVNTKDPIKVTDLVYFQLTDIKFHTGDSKNQILSIHFTLYTDDGTIADIKNYIKACRKEYICEKNNKLGNEIYFFDHMCDPLSTKVSDHITFSKKSYHTDKTFENLFYNDKKTLEKRVNHFLNNPGWYKKRGIPYTFGVMLWGPPGTGKTSTIKAITNISGRHIVNVRISNIKTNTQLKNLFQSDYMQIHDSVTNQTERYNIPISKRHYIIEDLDLVSDLIKRRDMYEKGDGVKSHGGMNPVDRLKELKLEEKKLMNSDNNDYMQRAMIEEEMEALKEKLQVENVDAITLDSLLNILDGTYEIPGRMLSITTNDPNVIDPALIRPGRIDMIIHCGDSTKVHIKEMFENFYEQEFNPSLFEKILDSKISPAKVIQTMFNNFDNPNKAIDDIIIESRKRKDKGYIRSS